MRGSVSLRKLNPDPAVSTGPTRSVRAISRVRCGRLRSVAYWEEGSTRLGLRGAARMRSLGPVRGHHTFAPAQRR